MFAPFEAPFGRLLLGGLARSVRGSTVSKRPAAKAKAIQRIEVR